MSRGVWCGECVPDGLVAGALAARCECGAGWRVLETLGEWAAQASVPELAHALGQAEARAEYWMAVAEANHAEVVRVTRQRDEWQAEATGRAVAS